MRQTKSGLPIVNQEQLQSILVNSNKGVLVLGKPGVGKTHVFSNHFGRRLSSHEVMTRYCENGMEAMRGLLNQHIIQRKDKSTLYIDDIGTEQTAMSYGTPLDTIQWLVYTCYEKNVSLYATTNLNLEELEGRYGPRAIERLKEMAYIVVLEDKNYRADQYNKNIQDLIDAKQEA